MEAEAPRPGRGKLALVVLTVGLIAVQRREAVAGAGAPLSEGGAPPPDARRTRG